MANRTFVLMAVLVLALAFLFSTAGTTGNAPKTPTYGVGKECVGEGSHCGNNIVYQCMNGKFVPTDNRNAFAERNGIALAYRDLIQCYQTTDAYGSHAELIFRGYGAQTRGTSTG